MKHNSVIISGNDLCGAFGSYDSQDVADLLGFDNYESIDWAGFWHVSWPEHVSSPRYNSDANYSFVGAAGVVIECSPPKGRLRSRKPCEFPRK